MQDFIEQKMKDLRAHVLSKSDQLTLGGLISELKKVKEKGYVLTDGYEPKVYFDFAYFFPKNIDSWRGSYSELALDYSDQGEAIKLSDFISKLEKCIGEYFDGYKGGEFLMDESTPIWVSNYGQACHTAVVGVFDDRYKVILKTGYREF